VLWQALHPIFSISSDWIVTFRLKTTVMKLLIIEDEKDIGNSIVQFMESAGISCEWAPDYFTAEDKLLSHSYEVVVLDITLPDGNGLSLLELLKKEHPNTGVVILSARNSLDDRLHGLDLGADDYVTKPFHLSELNSRINAVIRRRQFGGSTVLTFNEIEIDTQGKQVKVNGKVVELTKKEYNLLLHLVINKERVLTKEGIAEHLWGDQAEMDDNFDYIYTHIKNLRKKIEVNDVPNYLKTIYGVGYKLTDQ